jgi:hypothetical protein
VTGVPSSEFDEHYPFFTLICSDFDSHAFVCINDVLGRKTFSIAIINPWSVVPAKSALSSSKVRQNISFFWDFKLLRSSSI